MENILLNCSLCNIKVCLVDVIICFLCLIIIMFIVNSIKNKISNFCKDRILKNIMLIVSFIFSFVLIVSSIIFFYKTQMIRMLIPSALGIILLLANIVIYILFFENKEVE